MSLPLVPIRLLTVGNEFVVHSNSDLLHASIKSATKDVPKNRHVQKVTDFISIMIDSVNLFGECLIVYEDKLYNTYYGIIFFNAFNRGLSGILIHERSFSHLGSYLMFFFLIIIILFICFKY